ncbi:MAG TPA: transposase zinc-binding domain-containing protein [Gemmatimonadales bacterium]|jgi:hypothetical protein|nr:transposase zinc-binding domain-containing protein [Gemmatimonadales bacterium]
MLAAPRDTVLPRVVGQFLACALLEHSLARICCAACAYEYLLAFSGKAPYSCPSCHAKRLARWSLWLDKTLLAPVPHRQAVLKIEHGPPPRLRPVPPTNTPRPVGWGTGTRCTPFQARRRWVP